MNKTLIDTVGNTPLIEARNIAAAEGLDCRLLLKAEMMNPGGSVKDRAALAMIEDARRQGRLSPGATIIEPTSGNTGIGLAWIGRAMGYRVVLTMPETMSMERRQLLKAYGAEIVLTPGAAGMAGAIEEAARLNGEIAGSVVMGQFDNPANPRIHETTTGPEILRDAACGIAAFVAGVGSGGTVSGVGRALKQADASTRIVAVEPAASAVISGGRRGSHKIQGIGAGFIPANLDQGVVDEVMTVSDDEAIAGTRLLARLEGLLAGISSGAALSAALRYARSRDCRGRAVVVLLPDSGARYLSTGVFD